MYGHLPLAASTNGFQTAVDFLQKGGIFMIPLIITSVVGVMAIVYKSLSLSRNRIIPEQLASEISRLTPHAPSSQTEPLLREFQEGRSTLARLAAVAVKHSGKSQAEITQAVEASARVETVHLHAGIGLLDVIITVAPLLGLLGTASGLVVIFEGLGETTDHLQIAHGIAEALNTTISGLAIAVPCIIAHGVFTRRIERYTARLESLLSELVQFCKKSGSPA